MAGTGYTYRLEAAFGADPSAAPASWTWTDITADVFGKVDVDVAHGRSSGASQSEPCKLSFTLKNGAGTYTPDNANSIRWPNIRLNLPLRFSNSPSGSFVVQAVALVTSIIPNWDEPTQPLVAVLAEGSLRRLRQGDQALRSPLYRSLISPTVPVGYWSMEDPNGSTSFAEASGGQPAVWSGTTPTFASAGPAGSSPLPKLAAATRLDGTLASYTSATAWTVAFVLNVPSAATVLTTGLPIFQWFTAGSALTWRFTLFLSGGTDTCAVEAWSTTGAVVISTSMSFTAGTFVEPYGEHLLVKVTATQNAGNVDYTLTVAHPTFGSSSTSASVAGTVGNVTAWQVPNGWDHTDMILGHVAFYSAVVAPNVAAVSGFTGETASARITRICTEQDVQLALTGSSTDAMGPQPINGFTAILAECEAVDGGILRDAKTGGLAYVCRTSLYNQTAAMVLDHRLLQTFVGLRPVLDDLGHVNDDTVSRTAGSSARVTNAADIAATDVYPSTASVNTSTDAQLTYQAGWRVGLGTPGVMRYPTVTVDLLARPDLVTSWLTCDLGSRITLRNVPDQPNDVDLLIVGYTVGFNAFRWFVTINCESYVPWQVHVIGTDRIQSVSSTLTGALTAAATSFTVATASGPLWTTAGADFPQDIDIDGERITISAISGSSSPQTFTVAAGGRARNSVTKAHLSGASVYVWRPRRIGL